MTNLKASIFLLIGILLLTGTASLLVFLSERKKEAIEEQVNAAGRAMDEGDLDGAVAAWEGVLAKDPDNREAGLALFDTVAFFDREAAQAALARLESMPVDEERVLFRKVRLALMEDDLTAAREAVAKLESHKPLDLEGELARLLLFFAEGNAKEGLRLLAQLESTWPANRQLRLLTAEILAMQEALLERVSAKDGLMRLMERTDEFSFRAAAYIVLGNGLPLYPEDREAALEHLRSHPWHEKGMAQVQDPVREALVAALSEAKPEPDADALEQARTDPLADLPARLRATELLMRLEPARRVELLEEVTAGLSKEDTEYTEVDYFMLGGWLLRMGEAERALEVSEELDFERNLDALSLRFDALMALERFDEAEAVAEAGAVILEEWQEDLLQANVFVKRREFGAARRVVEDLIREVPNSPVLFKVAQLARETGAERLQETAYDRAWEAGLVFPRREAMEYLAMLLNASDLDASLRFTAYCRTLEPGEPIYVNNHSYMQLVAGREIDDAVTDMRELVERFPDFQPFRLTLAMAQLVGGYPGQARETLEPLGDKPGLADARSKLSMALVLAGSGEHQKADELIDSIDIASLMNAEQELVDLYLRDGTF